MMTDLIRRLRTNPMKNKILREAADELEKLEIMNTRLRAALQQLASMAESGARAYDDNELRDLLIEMDNHGRRALEPKP